MEFLKLDNNINDYYILEEGTMLYRGDNNNITVNDYSPRFFVKNKENTKTYGKIIYEFQVKEDLKLLAIDKNITFFYDNAPEDIQKILRENYGYISKKRLSESIQDNNLLNYICNETKYDGYAANKMDTIFSHFDPEITICEPNKNLTTAVNISELSDEDSKMANAEARLVENEKERKRNRKRKNRFNFDDEEIKSIPMKYSDEFNDNFNDNFNDEKSGGKIKTRKTRKSKKSKRKTRRSNKSKRKTKKSKKVRKTKKKRQRNEM